MENCRIKQAGVREVMGILATFCPVRCHARCVSEMPLQSPPPHPQMISATGSSLPSSCPPPCSIPGATSPENLAGLPRVRARACQGRLNRGNQSDTES